MAQDALNESRKTSDLVKWETNPRYTRLAVSIENTTGGALEDVVLLGQPVQDNGDGTATLVLDTEEANTNAIVIDDREPFDWDAGVDAEKVIILREGPAIVNDDRIADSDVTDAAFTGQAAIRTGLADEGIKTVSEASPSETQTT